MKMAKPTARDIEAGYDLLGVLSAIDSRFGGPWPTDGPDDLEAIGQSFDCDSLEHLQALYNSLAKLLRTAPNFYGRVIGGMCGVICWDQNCILDPAKNHLELHPDIREGLTLLAERRADFIPRLEREARAALADAIERSAIRHINEMKGREA